ncbi:hypothetical protein V8E51_006087 [Hyaloscypha variabilis]
MAKPEDQRLADQNSSHTRDSTPISERGTPGLSSSSCMTADRSEPDTEPDWQPLHPTFTRIVTTSDPSSRSATPLSQASANEEDDNGNENIMENVTVAGSLASSDGHGWPYGGTRESTPAANESEGEEDNGSEVGSEGEARRFERSRAPSPPSHMPTPREGTPAAESQGTSLDAIEEDTDEEEYREEAKKEGEEVRRDILDYVESKNEDDDGDTED